MQEAQPIINDGMEKQWESAKDKKTTTAALIATGKRALEDLNRVTDDALDELAGWAAEYARLSLSGSFSAPLEKAIRLQEQRCMVMEVEAVTLKQLAKARKSLEQMKDRLDILGKAKERVPEGVRKGNEVKEKVGSRKPEELPTGAQKDEGDIQKGAQKVWGGVLERVKQGARRVGRYYREGESVAKIQ